MQDPLEFASTNRLHDAVFQDAFQVRAKIIPGNLLSLKLATDIEHPEAT